MAQIGIPREIMQTWKNHDIPERWRDGVESIQRVAVADGWKHVLMTDDDNRQLVAEYFPDFLSTFDSFPYPIQRADAIRVCYLYLYGGIYMDLDFEIQKPLDDLFENGELFFVPSGNLSGMYTNAFMASKPRHPFWLEYLEEMRKPAPWWAMGKHLEVMTTTGPMALTRTLKNTKYPYVSLPSALLTPCSVCDLRCEYSNGSYLRQLDGGSWNGWDSLTYNWMMCNWGKLLITIALVVLAMVVLWIVG